MRLNSIAAMNGKLSLLTVLEGHFSAQVADTHTDFTVRGCVLGGTRRGVGRAVEGKNVRTCVGCFRRSWCRQQSRQMNMVVVVGTKKRQLMLAPNPMELL